MLAARRLRRGSVHAMPPQRLPFRLRDGRVEDLPALLALEAQFPGDRLSWRQLRRHLQSNSAVLRIAIDDAGVQGYALTLLRHGSRVARLYSIVVDPNARGRGIGGALLVDADAVARKHGATRLRLEVRADNAGAIALYVAKGYVQIGQRERYYEDGATARVFEKQMPQE